jgi:hypothetical protein
MFRREGLSPKVLDGLQPPRLDHSMRHPQKPEQGSVTALKEILQQGEQKIQNSKMNLSNLPVCVCLVLACWAS